MLTAAVLYGDENGGEATPWVSLGYQAEVPNGPMSVAAHAGVTAVGNYAELLDLGVHGRYYVAGGFAELGCFSARSNGRCEANPSRWALLGNENDW